MLVDGSNQVLIAELVLPQLEPTIDVLLYEIGIVEHASPPTHDAIGIAEVSRRVTCAEPRPWIVVASIRGIQRSIKVPDRTGLKFSVRRFVVERTKPQRIDVHC